MKLYTIDFVPFVKALFTVLVVLFYVIVTNYIDLSIDLSSIIEKSKFSLYYIIFFITIMTVYVLDQTVPLQRMILYAFIITIFFYLVPIVKIASPIYSRQRLDKIIKMEHDRVKK